MDEGVGERLRHGGFNQQGFRLQRSHAYQPRVKPWERGQRDGCVLKERRRGVDRARVRCSEICGVPSERGDWGRGRPRALLWAGMHCPCGANGCLCSCLHLLRVCLNVGRGPVPLCRGAFVLPFVPRARANAFSSACAARTWPVPALTERRRTRCRCDMPRMPRMLAGGPPPANGKTRRLSTR